MFNAIKEFSESDDLTSLEEGNNLRTLDIYLQDISLLTDADHDDKGDSNKVSLMTIHSAKGLEFPYVYIVGLEENLFPSIQSIGSRNDLEEERRLFYVALTRAEKAAFISYAETRYRWGNLTMSEPSRFIYEIDPSYIEQPKKVVNHPSDLNKFRYTGEELPKKNRCHLTKTGLKKIEGAQYSTSDSEPFESAEIDRIHAGMQVEHQRFGKGKVLSTEGIGANRKATVFFRQSGRKI